MRPIKTLVSLGDSITQGGQASKGEHNWVSRLAGWLGSCQGAPTEVINLGVGGSVVSPKSSAYDNSRKPSGLEKFQESLPTLAPADLVTVAYGFNDARGGSSVGEFQSNLAALVDLVLTAKPGIVLLAGPYYTSQRFSYGKEWSHGDLPTLQRFNQAVAEVARQKECLYADVLTPLAGGNWLLAADGVHPNDFGHLLIAATICRTLLGSFPDGPPAAKLTQKL